LRSAGGVGTKARPAADGHYFPSRSVTSVAALHNEKSITKYGSQKNNLQLRNEIAESRVQMLHALTVELASSGRIRMRSDDYFEMRKGGEIVCEFVATLMRIRI